MSIDTTFQRRCIASLERAMREIRSIEDDEVLYNICRAACGKELKLVLDQSEHLLRKRLAAYFATNRQADRLNFKDLFRHAGRHDLIGAEGIERWLRYRDNRTDTAHDYGEDFTETTPKLLPGFIEDAMTLADMVEQGDDG